MSRTSLSLGAAFLAVALFSAGIIFAIGSGAVAQATAPGTVDPETAGVYLFSAGIDTGDVECLGLPGGTPTDEIVGRAVANDVLTFIGDVDPEIVDFQPGSDIETPSFQTVDSTRADVTEGLTAIDDFGDVANGNDDTANADIGHGGSLTLRLAEGLVIAPDGVVATGVLTNGPDPVANLDGFEIFMFEDAELSGMNVQLQGPSQLYTFDIRDFQINPNAVAGADDTLMAIDLDSLPGWTDPWVLSIGFIDDAVDAGGVDSCPGGTVADTSVEIDAVAVRSDVLVEEPAIDIEKTTNGLDADIAPGPALEVGDAVLWEYIVTNTGRQDLTNVVVTDDIEANVVCPQDTLAIGEAMTCQATGVAFLGAYANVGTVTATPETGNDLVESDPSHYTVASQPAVTLKKFVNGEDADEAPGHLVSVGGRVFFRYDVTNVGNGPLVNLTVVDDVLGDICTIDALEVGQTEPCFAVDVADPGLITNVGTVTGTGPQGGQVFDTDPANYTGLSVPSLDLEKLVNGFDADVIPGPTVAIGAEVTWTYRLTNTGNSVISNIVVTDDIEGAVCEVPSLAAGATTDCELTGTAVPGQYTNVGSATGTDALGTEVGDTDPANHFTSGPAITLEKATNGVDSDALPGESLAVGSSVEWTYEVTNTGNVALAPVTVNDDLEGRICSIASLAPGATDTCTATGVVQAGQYRNIGSVVGRSPSGEVVRATDPSSYFGAAAVLTLEKTTNGVDADTAPGPQVASGAAVEWVYTVSNGGTVTVTDIAVTDDIEGAICTIASLAPGETTTCSATGVAGAGAYQNLGTVSGTDPSGNAVGDTDPSNHIAIVDGLLLQKSTNGEDADMAPGPYVSPGDRVEWVYEIQNLGNFPVNSVVVTDDVIGEICRLATLGAGETRTCTASGTAIAGQYENIGSVTATSPSGATLTSSDPSHYFGQTPSVVVEKSTNGVDADTAATAASVVEGAAVVWTYDIENDGNVALTNVVVRDNLEGEICQVASLAPGETTTCEATGVAVAGAYRNVAAVVGDDPTGNSVRDTDPSNYFGEQSGLDIVKRTNGELVSATETGPVIQAGDPVTWTYLVTNNGNVALTTVIVVDSEEGVICTLDRLEAGANETCELTGVARGGQYRNDVAASGVDPSGNSVGAESQSGYFGAGPGIDVEKTTNGEDADVVDGPLVAVGDPVTWVFTVTNTGNVDLTGVRVEDDQLGLVCEAASLVIGEAITCTVDGVATEGRHQNVVTATGNGPGNVPVEDTDPSNYFGVNSGIAMDKLINGEPADTSPGVLALVGETVTFTFEVANIGNVELTDVTVEDSVFGSVCGFAVLAVGATETCTLDHVVEAGQHTNVATGSGVDPLNQRVGATDPAFLFGTGPGIVLEKSTNGVDSDEAPGQAIPVGDPVEWTYDVTNVGNVELIDVIINDSREGRICRIASLAVDATASCTETDVARAGEYFNIGDVRASTATGEVVTDTDPSHYTGVIGALGDYVWVDLNEDGLQDAGEPGVAGVTVVLWQDTTGDGAPDTELAQTITDSDGRYTFRDLVPADNYIVQFVVEGNPFTQQVDSDVTLNSDADPATGITAVVSVPANASNLDVDAGLLPATIGDRVWMDTNANGQQDDGEDGVAGVSVLLLVDANGDGSPDGQAVDRAVTDADGKYEFTGVDPHHTYVLRFVPAEGALTVPLTGDPATDSDAAVSTGLTPTVSVGFGENNPTIDAGIVPAAMPGSIGDTVWVDANANGVIDGDEVGIAGVTVELLLANGRLYEAAVTDADGKYLFSNLPAAKFLVEVDPATLPAGLAMTYDLDGNLDGRTVEILETGEAALDHDFGYVELAAIGDFVWNDADGNGVQDDGEPGVAGVDVVLWTWVDGAPGEIVERQSTDDNGAYRFDGVDPRNEYVVQLVPADGWILTQQGATDDPTADSNFGPDSGLSTPISLASGQVDLTIDAGILRAPASIGDTVWMDSNENGVQDTDENGLEGIEVNLWTVDGDGAPETQIDTATTGANGLYAFVNLDPDLSYVVQVMSPEGWLLTAANSGPSDEVDSDFDPATGISAVITLTPGEDHVDTDAGLLPKFADIELVVLSGTARIDDGDAHPVVDIPGTVTLTYTATNTGDWDLEDVLISDPVHGDICTIDVLKIGESETCTEEVSPTAVIIEAVATATGDPIDAAGDPAEQLDGTAVADPSDVDPLAYEGNELQRALVTPTPVPPTSTVVPPSPTPVPPTATPVPPAPIAITGQSSSSLALLAGSLLIFGAALVIVADRRRRLAE